MSEMKHAAVSGERMSVVLRKHRAALTRDERKVLALKRNAEQAVLVCERHKAVIAAQSARLAEFEAAAVKAQQEYEAAAAALEAK